MKVTLVVTATLGSFGLAEVGLRLALFSNIGLFESLRNPAHYGDWFSDDDYWKLQYRFGGQFQPPTDPHPLLGWVGAFSRDSYIHHTVAEIRDRRPVLLYGDSFGQCVEAVLCFEDILNEDPEFAQHHYLLNYAVGGYGVDQIFLLMQNSVHLYRDPFVVLSLMTADLDRNILAVRTGQKPYFRVEDGELILSGVPIDSDAARFFAEHPPGIRSYVYRGILHSEFLPQRVAAFLRGDEKARRRKEEVGERIIVAMIDTLRANNIDFVFLVFHYSEGDGWRDVFLRRVLGENDVPYIWSKEIVRQDRNRLRSSSDTVAVQRGADRASWDEYISPSTHHPTTYLNRLIASEIARYVTKKVHYEFLHHLGGAEIVTDDAGNVRLQTAFLIGGDEREAMFQHPESEVIFDDVPIADNAVLTFAIGIAQSAWGKSGDGVLFEIIVIQEQSKRDIIFSQYVDAKHTVDDRRWFAHDLALTTLAGQKVTFIFRTSSGPTGNQNYDWAGWSGLQIRQAP